MNASVCEARVPTMRSRAGRSHGMRFTRLPSSVAATFLVVMCCIAQAAIAQGLLYNCGGGAGVGGPPTYLTGEPVYLIMCRSGVPDGPYLGTVTLTTSDPTIVVPAPYTFTLADNRQFTTSFGTYWSAYHDFGFAVVFKAPGRRIIDYSFTTGGGAPGYSSAFDVTVVGSVTAIPTLADMSLLLTAVLVVLVGWSGLVSGRCRTRTLR